MKSLREEALRLLEKDKIRNCNMINFIEQYPIERIEIMGKSVLARGISDEIWNYISSENRDEFEKLIEKNRATDTHFAVLEDWMLPYLTLSRTVVWQLTCIKLVFTHDVSSLPANKHNVIELKPEDAQYIYNHYGYQKYTSVEYITNRIKSGNALGIYEDSKLVAWIATHDDGAMGLLHVLPEYRRKGYGYELTVALIMYMYEQGKLPFIHIEEDNVKSMNLALKVGFVKDRRIHWVKMA
jgi:8-oxo-dGTP diphosphatase